MGKRTKIPLLNFEDSIENDLLLEGEKLFDEGALKSISLNDKGRWHARVGKDFLFHVHVDVFGDHIERADCTCGRGSGENFCQHLVCTFYGIRQADPVDYKTPPPKKRKRKQRNKAILSLLEHATKEELGDFILGYVGKDRKFSLLLRTHFARKSSELSGKEVYDEILDQAFPIVSEANVESPAKNQQMLITVSREMLVHYKDALSLEQYTEAFYMIRALIQKLAYAIHVKSNPSSALIELLDEVHHALPTLILDIKLAPGLKQDILESLINTAGRTYYLYKKKNNLFTQVLQSRASAEQLKELKSIVKEKMELSQSLHSQVHYLCLYIEILERSHAMVDPDTWLYDQLKDPYMLLESINKMIQKGQTDMASAFLDSLYTNHQVEEGNYHKMRLKVHAHFEDPELALDSAIALLDITGDYQYINQIRELSGKSWPKQYLKILKLLLAEKTEHAMETCLDLASREKDQATIAKILRTSHRLDWYMKYDVHISSSHPTAILDFYKEFLTSFHQDHAGLIGVNKTVLIMDHLLEIGLKKEYRELQNHLRQHFPERKSLQEIL